PGASSLLCASSPRPSRRCTNLLSAGVSPFGGQRIVFKTRATPDNIGLVSSDGAKGGSNVHRRLLAATAEFERGFVSRTSFFGELKRQARPSNAARLSSVTSKFHRRLDLRCGLLDRFAIFECLLWSGPQWRH